MQRKLEEVQLAAKVGTGTDLEPLRTACSQRHAGRACLMGVEKGAPSGARVQGCSGCCEDGEGS